MSATQFTALLDTALNTRRYLRCNRPYPSCCEIKNSHLQHHSTHFAAKMHLSSATRWFLVKVISTHSTRIYVLQGGDRELTCSCRSCKEPGIGLHLIESHD